MRRVNYAQNEGEKGKRKEERGKRKEERGKRKEGQDVLEMQAFYIKRIYPSHTLA